MDNQQKKGYFWIPIALTAGIVAGLFIGRYIITSHRTPGEEKLHALLGLINKDYVDEVNLDSLIDYGLPQILAYLDPHSAYMTPEEMIAANHELASSFSGVGVQFMQQNDSVTVVEVVTGGPADKVGLMAGDRIVSADGKSLVGPQVTSDVVFKALRGKAGTKVKLKVKRSSSSKLLDFDVTRGEVPQTSIDGAYMMDKETGYLRVGKFAQDTFTEFLNALGDLQSKGAGKFIIDLRGNTGGFMDQAIMMANEFLPKGRMIVYSKGRSRENETTAVSDGNGIFQDCELTVITNEYSASAAEIFAGAIQDNDRGLVIGRRTFGKGLVQNQTIFPDSSAVRLTVARYYTPSGRCIQKEYSRGKAGTYDMDIIERYNHGEFYSADSIKLDKSKRFHTFGGRTVYGGGGIMPDIFVPEDTSGYTSYYVAILNKGLLQDYSFRLADSYRTLAKNVTSVTQLERMLPRDQTLLENFVAYAAKKGVPARWYYINQSRQLILLQLKALVARDLLGIPYYFEIINRHDPAVKKAYNTLKQGKSPKVIRK